jgi:plasmid stabilization system protein ParE
MSVYALTPLAKADIFDIWSYIAVDSEEIANRVEQAIYDGCAFVAEAPTRGHSRSDLTSSLPSFLDAYPLSQLHRCLPARDGSPSGCRRSAREEKYTAHTETELTVLRDEPPTLARNRHPQTIQFR